MVQRTPRPGGPEWVLVALGLTVSSRMFPRMDALGRAVASGKATPPPSLGHSGPCNPQPKE